MDTRSTKVLILDKETAHILNNFVEMTDILNSGISREYFNEFYNIPSYYSRYYFVKKSSFYSGSRCDQLPQKNLIRVW